MDPERDIGNGSIKVNLGLMMTEKILVNGCCTCKRDKEEVNHFIITIFNFLFLFFFFFLLFSFSWRKKEYSFEAPYKMNTEY